MSIKVMNLEEVLREIENLEIEDQVYILEILNKRLIESKRAQIARRAREAEHAFKAGKVKRGSFEMLWKDLND